MRSSILEGTGPPPATSPPHTRHYSHQNSQDLESSNSQMVLGKQKQSSGQSLLTRLFVLTMLSLLAAVTNAQSAGKSSPSSRLRSHSQMSDCAHTLPQLMEAMCVDEYVELILTCVIYLL